MLAETAELRLSAMLFDGTTIIVLAAVDRDGAVAVPAANGAEIYLALRAAERYLFSADNNMSADGHHNKLQ